mmetsp:Transcript_13329/g.20297  ORF Transcript_13329/g.20297 Transcript_13329/m.20297 type:complete len:103 (-) Transcript_13329:622-930(-)|eukprot:CAMPEP_0178913650 /NCGR_PEP_ID=MMETSP0786-20121207/10966_1 /TAXON_ID=186022 /ORGANISM="Thalassionema frauenfeldii, Strain CCMP 1798" /LENGTH=102 /DNA_ID=CAMNT_0020586427 /DNA_START=1444 /DNA_END=1752 /DNA_ORIENTATION=+
MSERKKKRARDGVIEPQKVTEEDKRCMLTIIACKCQEAFVEHGATRLYESSGGGDYPILLQDLNIEELNDFLKVFGLVAIRIGERRLDSRRFLSFRMIRYQT